MSLSDPVEEEPITTESENEPAVEELNPSAEHPDQLAYTAAEEALALEPNQQAESTVEPHTSEPAAEPGDSPLSTANIEQELSDTENRELLKMFLQLPPLNSEDLQEAAASPAVVEITPLLQERILNTIDMGGLLATINEWVAIPSLDGTPEEVAVQEKVAETMRANGLEVETWAFNYEELQDHPAFSVEVERPRGLGVVGILGHGPGRTLILNGHTDVVPAGDLAQWTVPPWQATVNRKEGRVYGRGALDMKGNLACAVYAAKAIKEAGIELNGRVLIQSVMGEEDGGVGTLAAVTRGYTADAAIVLEPTELMIAPAQAGALNFRVIIPGYPAHGAMRAEGVDPLEKFLLIYQAILTFEKVRNSHVDHPMFTAYELPYPICVGTIHGGNWASTVAESLTFEGRLGIAVDEKPAEARHKFEQLIAHAGQADPWLREHPPTVEWWGGQFAPAAIRTNHPIIKTLSNAFTQVTQQEPTLQGMPYGADMRLLVNEGNIPTVMFGAGDVRKAHQFDEYVPLDELETVVKTIALTIAHFCGIRSVS